MDAPALPRRYSVASLLGEGGQGRVYRVHDSLRDRDLALKLVSAADAEFLRREFDTLRQIRHENLIQVFDWGTLDSGEAYYTMELVEGEDWGARMGTAQPADEVRRILTGLLRGLAHLHCHGELHGDLKPGNVLLGQGGVVKVTDVGMAGSEKGGIAGTPGYTAPECWEGKPVDIRADLYSVGVMAYEALTGKHPFGGRTIREVVAGQIEGWVPSPGAHGVKVPVDLERVVMRALEREAALRQGSADEYMEGFGVEDRVGLILGGRFVDPAELVPTILERLHRSASDPTLVYLAGAPGSGKSELIEQVSHAFVRSGVRCIRVTLNERTQLSNALTIELQHVGSAPASLDGLAEQIVSTALLHPLAILVDVDATVSENVASDPRALAQRIYAESFQRGEGVPVVIVVAAASNGEADIYATEIRIPELSEANSASLVGGLLGQVDLAPGAARALHEATGGTPSSLHAILFDLIRRGSLSRVSGRWILTEVGGLQRGASPTLANRWIQRWGSLGAAKQELLGAIGLLQSVNDKSIPALEALTDCAGGIANLAASGWLKQLQHRWQFVSDGVRANVLGRLEASNIQSLARRLQEHGLAGESPAMVEIELLAAPRAETVAAAFVEGTAAFAAQNAPLARSFLALCLRHQAFLADHERANLHLMLAELSLSSGDLGAAGAHAREDVVSKAGTENPSVASRAHWVFGVVAGRAGRMEEAVKELETASIYAREAKANGLLYRAIASRAELAWTDGSDEERASVIVLARQTLDELIADQSADLAERGRLAYTLGASLIRTKQFEEAVSLLHPEVSRGGQPYWRARAANALGTACFYLGRYESSLGAYDIGLKQLGDGQAPEVRARIYANRGACLNAMGRVREGIHDNERAFVLSTRAGSSYDVIAAAAGIAVGLYYVGRYEGAIERAREVTSLAARIQNVIYEFKGLEIEAFAALELGDFDSVDRLLSEVDRLPTDHDPVWTLPRIERIRARRYLADGNKKEARAALHRAMELLKDENDLEDLWGVQVELTVLDYLEGTANGVLDTLALISAKAAGTKNIVVEVDAAAAIAEIVSSGVKADAKVIRSITSSLAKAEEAGFVSQAARISVGLGIALIDAGEGRSGQARLVQAQRLLLQIASELTPRARQSFVRSPHVASALAHITRHLTPSSN